MAKAEISLFSNPLLVITVIVSIASLTNGTCDCLLDPTQMCCMSWTYEYAISDVAGLCTMSHGGSLMFACGLSTYCRDHTLKSKYCNSFSILADICVSDGMGGMSGCKNYTKLCPSGTMVTQCSSNTAMPDIPTTSGAKQDITSLCGMEMPECTSCVTPSTGAACNCKSISSTCVVPNTTSLMLILSSLCLDMPGMSGCDDFHSMCSAAGSDFDALCGTTPSGGGDDKKICNGFGTVMYMDGMKGSISKTDSCVVFLFDNWVLDTKAKLAFGIIGAFLLGILQSAIGVAGRWFNKRHPVTDNLNFSDFGRLGIFLLETTNAYVLMLLAMTYFSGMFVAIVSGLAIGRIFLGQRFTNESNLKARKELEGPSRVTCCE